MRIKALLLLPFVSAFKIENRCASIYGLETEWRNFVCSWKHPVSFYLDKLHEIGVNTLRLPFSMQYIQEGDLSKMDDYIGYAAELNMSVILDCHRMSSSIQDATPFSTGMSLNDFVNLWLYVVNRYNSSENVIGINSYNENQSDNVEEINGYSKAIFDAVEFYFPNRFMYFMTGSKWASDLRNIGIPDAVYKDRLYYSVHKYYWSGTHDKQDWDTTIPFTLNSSHVVIGEVGWTQNDPAQVEWINTFLSYLQDRGIETICYWTLSTTRDTSNLFSEDCETMDWDVVKILHRFWDKAMRRIRRHV